jgi:hypothetical protein
MTRKKKKKTLGDNVLLDWIFKKTLTQFALISFSRPWKNDKTISLFSRTTAVGIYI